jgi:hypothetical protein
MLESRAVVGAMTNKLNAHFTGLHLKNNYKWKDRQEIDQTTTSLNYNKDITDLTDKELDDILDEIN